MLATDLRLADLFGHAGQNGMTGVGSVIVSGGRLYGIPEATGWSARTGVCAGPGRLGLELSRLGGELYEERTLGVLIAVEPSADLHVGAAVRGLGIAARGTDDLWSAAMDVAVARLFIGRLIVGAQGTNITRSRIGESPIAARTTFAAALVAPSASVQWSFRLENSFDLSTVLSVEAPLGDWLRVRLGASGEPPRIGCGVGVGREGTPWPVVDMALQWHPELGVSTFVSATFTP
jgi:hypothetical protein